MSDNSSLWWPSPTNELGHTLELALEEPFLCDHGGILDAIEVRYQSWGELDPTRENAVLIIHPMTADCHVTGEWQEQPTGWWEPLVGPGRAIDTDRSYVVCPNLLGGCYGTTGPRYPGPDGSPYLDRFPLLTPRDMMRVQRRFLEALGVRRLAFAVGPSMGGMIAWEWAIEASDFVDRVAVVAAPLRTTSYQIGLNWLQRRGIETDITEGEVVARVGQMIARGVGMLSYRSPIGLEEKFAREWFKEPGSTLGERGMYNVESWLRHHGKRITKKFDPWTYLLYSRAMDLHDVGRGHPDLVAALDRVDCRVEVVGISTDALYPRDEVRHGAEILRRLGREVNYSEIRSPHGHDAFLLETDQLGEIIGQAQSETREALPLREVRRIRVGLIGAGRVATALARRLRERQHEIARVHGLSFEIRRLAETNPANGHDPVFEGASRTTDARELVLADDLDVLVELTPGDELADLVEEALARGRPVVTPNKTLLHQHGDRLEEVAAAHGVRIAWHNAIAAGWPLIHALSGPLHGKGLLGIRAAVSSALNVYFDRLESGAGSAEARAQVIAAGLTEPDPDLDFTGWDSAQKLGLLMAHVFGVRPGTDAITTHSALSAGPDLVQEAPKLGYRVRYVARADLVGNALRATVGPMAVPEGGHLGDLRGPRNLVLLETDDGGEMAYLGDGAGTLPVAVAVLNDLIGLFDPDRSWTGRVPSVTGRLPEPAVERWLRVSDAGRIGIGDEPGPGSIPVLDPD